MSDPHTEPVYHMDDRNWRYTPEGEPRGYIQPQSVSELWFHTGTTCNLRCPSCFEGSHPGSNRLEQPALNDVAPFIHEAVELGTKRFCFTGGEPFVNRHMVDILDFALDFNPCFVLTNGTEPLLSRLPQLEPLRSKRNPLSFRVSLDFPDPAAHDRNRGQGRFNLSIKALCELHRMGFSVSVARRAVEGEDETAVNNAYVTLFREKSESPVVAWKEEGTL